MQTEALTASSVTSAVAKSDSAEKEGRPFTAKDLATLDRISDPQLSPDGRWLAYSLRSTDWENSRGFNSLWILDRKSPELPPRRLDVSDKSATMPRWSRDGRTLYYLSPRSGSPQVWRTDAAGVITTQVTDLSVAITSYRVSPDGQTLVVAMVMAPGCSSPASTKVWESARKSRPTTATLFDKLPLLVWDDWRAGERTQLFALRLGTDGVAGSEPTNLMNGIESEAPARPFGSDSDFAVSDREVIFSALAPGSAWGIDNRYVLYTNSLDGSEQPRQLNAPDEDIFIRRMKPTLSPDGMQLAFLAQRSGFDDTRVAVVIRQLHTGSERELAADLDRSANGLAWAPDGQTLYAIMPDCGRTRLFAISVSTGIVRACTDAGEVAGISAQAERLIVCRSSLDNPSQLYELAADGEKKLTEVNKERLTGIGLARHERFSFAGWNGETVHGTVMQPNAFAPDQKYPVAFLIHGGPHGTFSDAWSYRWNPQVWAGMGFAVVTIDFHGSIGYGEAFAKSVVGHWGDRPLVDLQLGLEAALEKYSFLDSNRLCALGGSYGGFMVAWLASVWSKPWKCFVMHNGIFDTRGMAMSSDVTGWMDYQFGGPPIWENVGKFDRFNPLIHAGQWSKPILVIHSARDRRVPLEQGLAAFTMAQRRGVPSKLLYFDDENHWVQRAQNSVEWYRTVEAWIRQWI